MDSFRPFCDGCGIRFEAGQLRPQSKFCHHCGEQLSLWIRKHLVLRTPATPPITPARQLREDEPITPTTPQREDQDQPQNGLGEIIVENGILGRGRGRGRGSRRGRGRGRSTSAPQVARELRTAERPDYSVQHYFRETFYGNTFDKPEKVVLRIY